MQRKTEMIILIILLFAFYIRFETLNTPRDFWHDEAFQYLYSEKPVSFILDSNDVHPPLFNLFTKCLSSIGIYQIFYLRGIMLIISIIFLLMFFLTVKDIFNENIAIISTIAISFAYTYIYYSTEFRNYMFVLLFVILQIRYFNQLLDDEPVVHWYIFFSLLMLYSHYLSALIILCQLTYFIIKYNDYNIDVKTEVLAGMFVTAIFSIPLLYYILKTLPKIQSFWFKDIDLISLISTYSYILAPPTDYIYGFSLFYLVILGTMIYYHKDLDKRILQFSLYLILPVILMWTISQAMPFYHHRYFLFGGISFFILLGWSADTLNKKLGKDIDMFILAIWLVLFIMGMTAFYNSFNTELYDSAVFLYNHTDNGTQDFAIVHTSVFSQSPYKVYYIGVDNYLLTNMTRQELFTAGGSVINNHEIRHNLSFVNEINKTVYAISDRIVGDEIIYTEGGLYVTEINKKNK